MRTFLFFVIFVCSFRLSFGQLIYPIVGTFQKKSAQGMAIYADSAYLMHNGGLCRVLDLRHGVISRSFYLGSASKNNHANTASFMKETFSNDYKMPLLYVSECYGRGRCFVEQLSGDSSILIQTIELFKNGKNVRVANWTLDNDHNYLYAIVRNRKELLDSAWNVRCRIIKCRIPNLSEGNNIKLGEKDILDQFDVIFPNVMQGVKIRGMYMYLVTGQPQSLSERKDAKREIYIIDLKKKRIVRSVDLSYVTTNEPEDIAFYGKRCFLYCGHEGGIYEVKLE
jgi:hypothetical protein